MTRWLKTRTPLYELMLVCVCAATAPDLTAQTPAPSTGSASQTSPASQQKKPQETNPFPDDTNSVPVLPPVHSSATPPPDAGSYNDVALPGDDADPVKSPDDSAPSTGESGSSSSSSGLDNLLKLPPDEDEGKHGRGGAPDQPHTESAKDDENVGSYYLEQRNWKAALSRFESAVVLDPENPDVYWGLAEAQRHVDDFASAKANYQKVMEYDPDSKHSKEAKKILQQPEMASAKAVAAGSSAK